VCIHGSLIKGIINHVFLVFLYFLIFVQVSKKIFYVNLVSLYMQTLFFFFIIINGYLKLARCIKKKAIGKIVGEREVVNKLK